MLVAPTEYNRTISTKKTKKKVQQNYGDCPSTGTLINWTCQVPIVGSIYKAISGNFFFFFFFFCLRLNRVG